MNRTYFTEQGFCTIGTMKGLHVSNIRSGWIEWAKREIKGFEQQWQQAIHAPEKKLKPTGRTYILRKWTPKKNLTQ